MSRTPKNAPSPAPEFSKENVTKALRAGQLSPTAGAIAILTERMPGDDIEMIFRSARGIRLDARQQRREQLASPNAGALFARGCAIYALRAGRAKP